jgi:hypothetical protein
MWIHCKSVTFQPHSNECGPQTLFALAVMALHHNPSEDILIPFMSPNLAQILRTWVGASLLLGKVNIPDWTTPEPTLVSLRGTSVPGYLFPWTGMIPEDAELPPKTLHLPKSKQTKIRNKRKPVNKSLEAKFTLLLPGTTMRTLPTSNSNKSSPYNEREKHKVPLQSKKATLTRNGVQLTMYDALQLPSPQSSLEFDHVWGHYPDTMYSRIQH